MPKFNQQRLHTTKRLQLVDVPKIGSEFSGSTESQMGIASGGIEFGALNAEALDLQIYLAQPFVDCSEISLRLVHEPRIVASTLRCKQFARGSHRENLEVFLSVDRKVESHQ